jgi:hypothetical protein
MRASWHKAPPRRHDDDMPRAVTVWEVELGRPESPEEVKGTLELSHRDLIFTPRDEARSTVRIPLDEIAKVKRLRGSPVLLVVRETAAGPERTAFYFAQPPPMIPREGERLERGRGISAFRNPARQARRDNISYLGLMNRENKATLKEWVRAVETAAGRARSGTSEGAEG